MTTYTPTQQEIAFMKAYRRCVAVADPADIVYFLENKTRVQDVDYEEEEKITNAIQFWSHIEDAWLMWCEAIDYAKETA
jgi:hypothetical protein